MDTLDKIELLGMEFFGYHGALPEEQVLGQRFKIDVVMYLSLQSAGITDELNQTINYAEIYSLTKNIVIGEQKKLIESVAETIATEILQEYPIQAVEVRVAKEHPPIPGVLQQVAVTIKRTQEELH